MGEMVSSLDRRELADYVSRQANIFFPDGNVMSPENLRVALTKAMSRMENILRHLRGKHHRQNGRPLFNHLNSDHYAMFLYWLSYFLGRSAPRRSSATKIFLLNKALHGIDVFFEVKLPGIFLFAHPVGTVLGRAAYQDFLVVMQNCTVGNIAGRYPRFGNGVVLCSGASVLGDSRIGNGVCLGAGSLVINTVVPKAHNAVGRATELRVFRATAPNWQDYFYP